MALVPSASATIAPRQEPRELHAGQQKLIVIGQVIGTHSERVSFCLEKEASIASYKVMSFHEILVPEHNKQEANCPPREGR